MMTSPEFSRPFPVEKLRDRPMHEKIEATQEECEALAQRLGLVALKDLTATLDLQRVHSGAMVEVKGRFAADVVQTCVVTLEPFESHISEPVEAYFARAESIPDAAEVEVDIDRSPEAIGKDGEIDLGELAAQHLSLALDPHPRKPGAVFRAAGLDAEAAGGDAAASPFAVLAEFRDKDKKDGGKDKK